MDVHRVENLNVEPRLAVQHFMFQYKRRKESALSAGPTGYPFPMEYVLEASTIRPEQVAQRYQDHRIGWIAKYEQANTNRAIGLLLVNWKEVCRVEMVELNQGEDHRRKFLSLKAL